MNKVTYQLSLMHFYEIVILQEIKQATETVNNLKIFIPQNELTYENAIFNNANVT